MRNTRHLRRPSIESLKRTVAVVCVLAATFVLAVGFAGCAHRPAWSSMYATLWPTLQPLGEIVQYRVGAPGSASLRLARVVVPGQSVVWSSAAGARTGIRSELIVIRGGTPGVLVAGGPDWVEIDVGANLLLRFARATTGPDEGVFTCAAINGQQLTDGGAVSVDGIPYRVILDGGGIPSLQYAAGAENNGTRVMRAPGRLVSR